ASVQTVSLSPPRPGIIPQAERAGAIEIAARPRPTVLRRVRRATPRRGHVCPLVFFLLQTSLPRFFSLPRRSHATSGVTSLRRCPPSVRRARRPQDGTRRDRRSDRPSVGIEARS